MEPDVPEVLLFDGTLGFHFTVPEDESYTAIAVLNRTSRMGVERRGKRKCNDAELGHVEALDRIESFWQRKVQFNSD